MCYLDGFNPLPEPEEDPQSRSLLTVLSPLKTALEIWNWTIFDGFKQWIMGRRGVTPVPYRPTVVNKF